MTTSNYTSQTITQQLAQRSGQIRISTANGGIQYVDSLTGRPLISIPAASSMLANPQNPRDPQISAKALDLARALFAGQGVPDALVEAVATVAAYTSVTTGIPVDRLLTKDGVSDVLLGQYNRFKPKSSQVGRFGPLSVPAWSNNPVLRGTISAAISEQP